MSSGPGEARDLSRKTRTQEARERVAELERELASLDELAQHLAVDVRSAEERLDTARDRCRWLSDKLTQEEQRNQDLDARIAATSAQAGAAEAQRRSAQRELRDKAEKLRLLRTRLRAEESALQAGERELAEVIEGIRRLGYAAECWTESSR